MEEKILIESIKNALKKNKCYVRLNDFEKTNIHDISHWSNQVVKIKRIENSQFGKVIVFNNKYYQPPKINPNGSFFFKPWHNEKECKLILFNTQKKSIIKELISEYDHTESSPPNIPSTTICSGHIKDYKFLNKPKEEKTERKKRLDFMMMNFKNYKSKKEITNSNENKFYGAIWSKDKCDCCGIKHNPYHNKTGKSHYC